MTIIKKKKKKLTSNSDITAKEVVMTVVAEIPIFFIDIPNYYVKTSVNRLF